jgi:uncharacterized membrane protein
VSTQPVVEWVGRAIDLAGVAIIAGGILLSVVIYAVQLSRRVDRGVAYREVREMVGRSVLLGLEFLVAGDIIRTVAVSPTFTSVGVLAAIVAIRTFLSTTLEMEISGRWPWQRRPDSSPRMPAE